MDARHHLYRSFLQHLQRIPNRHVWSVMQPRFRALLDFKTPSVQSRDEDIPAAESSRAAQLRESRRQRGLKRARSELHKLQAAVAYHPHAFRRLLEEIYGLRGAVRWELIRNIEKTSPPAETHPDTDRAGLPAPLIPFRPEIKTRVQPSMRIQKPLRPTKIRKLAIDVWTKERAQVRVPLVLSPGAGDLVPKTGWEGRGIIEELRHLAGLDTVEQEGGGMPEVYLPPHISRIYRSTPSTRSLPEFRNPPKSHTRQQGGTWHYARQLNSRSFRRNYRRLWNHLIWCKPSIKNPGQWEACEWEEIHPREAGIGDRLETTEMKSKGKSPRRIQGLEKRKWSVASEEEMRWIA